MAYRLTEGNATPFWFKHVATLVLGFVMMVYLQHFNFKYFSRISQLGIWVSGALLLVTLFFGKNVNSAQRWIMGFQPSDLAKIMLVLYTARLLTVHKDKIKDFRNGVVPILIPIGGICLLILPADFSTAFMLGTACFVLLYVGGVSVKHLMAIIGGAVGLLLMLIMLNKAGGDFLPRVGTWEKRMVSFLHLGGDDASTEIKEDNYQAQQGKMSVANGGLLGQGLGKGNIKNDLYSSQSDFVFSSIVEEMGLLFGAIPLLFLYMMFFFRSIRLMLNTPSKFGAYVAFGLSFMLVLQSMINMGVGVNLLPVTGQPLPLISMGGTSILFTCISIGIILNVSKTLEKESA